MSEYDLAHAYLMVLTINVPVMLVGLLPENYSLKPNIYNL